MHRVAQTLGRSGSDDRGGLDSPGSGPPGHTQGEGGGGVRPRVRYYLVIGVVDASLIRGAGAPVAAAAVGGAGLAQSRVAALALRHQT